MSDQQLRHESRIFGLDLIRALAIVLVVASHGQYLLRHTPLSGMSAMFTLDGVDLFFVLSGFLIGALLLKDLTRSETFGWHALVVFWKRRWFRTLPNYYLILLVNVALVSSRVIHEDIHRFNWKFFFFLQNFSRPFAGFFWESWSLAVEEWFYLIFPVLLIIIMFWRSAKVSFLLALLMMMVIPFAYRCWLYNPSADEFWVDIAMRKVVVTRLDSIAYGLLGAWVSHYYPAFWQRIRIPSFIVGLCLLVGPLWYLNRDTSFYWQVVHFSVCPLAVLMLMPGMSTLRTIGFSLLSTCVEHISKISYSMYLINLALVLEVIRDNFPPQGVWDALFKYMLYWLVVIGASSLLYRYFELPMMQLRDKKWRWHIFKR